MQRHDYAFPFRIDSASRQGAQTSYESHVEQMIRQVLLTSPGERADLPEFGCGLPRLLFAPLSDALVATTRIQVQQSLNQWLASQIQVQQIDVTQVDEGSQLLIQISYTLIETLSNKQMEVRVV